jgi:sugar O-acyltransferase (sialic acid O-acetyltransferase NeuD family)
MRGLVILGCGNFGQTAYYFFEHDSDYDVKAFVVDAEFQEADAFMGLPVAAFEEVQTRFPPDDHDMFVAVGLRDVNRQRAAKMREAEAKGYRLASYVSSRAVVPADLAVLPNTWIMETAHVHPYVTLGRHTIVWSRTTIGLKSKVGDDCWISGGLIGESVNVGDRTFVGLGATVASFVSVGKANIIGAGALVLKDTNDFEIYRGHGSRPSTVPSTRFNRFNG